MTTVTDGAEDHVVRFQRVASAERDGPGALAPLSFTLDAQARAWLIGPSGSGKSFALEMIARAAAPPRGRIGLFGVATETLTRAQRAGLKRRLGVVFQDPCLIDDLSALDNVALAARAVGRSPDRYLPQAIELLKWMGLGKRLHQTAGALTAEGRWRLALARALANGPELLLLDEPGQDLTPESRRALFKRVDDVHAAGMALLMALDEADAGAVALEGPAIRLTRPADAAVLLGAPA
jgi:cell division transport system ATP-binding protein